MATDPRRTALRALPAVWSLALALVLLGPALAPGYVLSYDMVWVPDLALRPDFLGLGSGLPRAVPSDAVVAVLDQVLPGMLLQKLVLVGMLTAGGAGAAALARQLPTPARCAAASVYVWNPYVVERLVLGHWPVLVGYAVLPWLVVAARRHRQDGRLPAALFLLVPLGSLSASAGLATALVVLAFGLVRASVSANARLVGLVAAANAPWVVAGLLHAADATSDAAGARLFAGQDEGMLPGPLAFLGLGGIWNQQVVPETRNGLLAVLLLVVLVGLAAVGVRSWRAATVRRDQVAFVACWLVGWGVAVLSWAAPDATGWLAESVPGGGLLRDGTRLLGLCVPLLAVLAAHGVALVAARLGGALQGAVVAGLLALVPLAFLPDAGWGSSGRLGTADYPASYEQARDQVGTADGADVLLLPFSAFRAPVWNDGRVVLDPLGRYLRPDYVASDVLVVGDTEVAGEDPRGDDVRRALDQPTAPARAAALAALGIGVVAVDREAPGEAVEVAGEVLLETDDLRVIGLGDVDTDPAPTSWWLGMLVAWAAYVGAVVTGVVRGPGVRLAQLIGNKRRRGGLNS